MAKEILVEPMSWQLEDEGKVKAEITQVPLRLAWAITVHKSQSMSIDNATIDLSKLLLMVKAMLYYPVAHLLELI